MAYAIAQTKAGQATATSFTIVWANNTTTGNLIVVGVGVITGTVSSITDSQSNTYTKATGGNANNNDGEIWYAQNITGGTTPTITVNLSATVTASGLAQEYSGMAASAFDKISSNTGIGGTGSSGNTSATTSNNELIVGFVANGSGTPTAGTGYGNLTLNSATSTNVVAIEDKRVTSKGVQAATFGGTTSIWSVCCATFAESTAVATATINVSDSATITESTSRTLIDNANNADTATTSESIGITLADNVRVSDTTTLTENVVSLIPFLLVNVSDSTTLSESIRVPITSFINKSDSSVVSENVAAQIVSISDLAISVSDSITLSEALQQLTVGFISKNDTSTITENIKAELTSNVNVSDTVSVTENLQRLLGASVSVSDSITITEQTTRLLESSVNVNDTSTITELVLNGGVPNPNTSNTITITESSVVAIQSGNPNVNDNVTVSESVLLSLSAILIATSDTVTISENISPKLAITLTISETITIAENIVSQPTSFINVSDTPTVTELVNTLIATIATLNINASDSINISESVTRTSGELAHPYRILRGPRGVHGPRSFGFNLPKRGPRQTRPPRSY